MLHTETIDHAGRPISEYIKINAGVDRMIGQSVYNYKDQLITRYQGNTGLGGSVDWLQKTDYTYRQDGLLSKINDNNLTGGVQPLINCSLSNQHTPSSGSSYDERDLFYSVLHYDETVSGSSTPKQYNGNISHAEWQVKGRRKQMYGYTYDEYNRPPKLWGLSTMTAIAEIPPGIKAAFMTVSIHMMNEAIS